MTTYILILIISLKSQFNHSLDVKYQNNISSEKLCIAIAEKTIEKLQQFNSNTEIEYSCIAN